MSARSPFDVQITGYRVRRGKAVVAEYSCPACPRRVYCLCAESATGCARRVIREQGGQVTVERLPDGAVLAKHDVPPKGMSAEDWKGFLAADVDEEAADELADEAPGVDVEMSANEARARVADAVTSEVADLEEEDPQ